jgi:hypothetical protein
LLIFFIIFFHDIWQVSANCITKKKKKLKLGIFSKDKTPTLEEKKEVPSEEAPWVN